MRALYLLLAAPLLLTACDSDGDDNNDPATFTVTVTNVSTPGTLDTDRAMGAIPLSPPAFAVFTGADPMFRPGQMANAGTERIAEDGFPEQMVALLNAASNVSASGAVTSPGGADDGPALFPALGGSAAESVTFTFTARPGARLQLETMFVQSNDWFYGFTDGGLELFDDGDPISGDVTTRLAVYDAGTEQDTAPGTGPDQKPVQDPMATDVGPDESVAIARAADRHPSFTIPATSQVIRVTVSSTR